MMLTSRSSKKSLVKRTLSEAREVRTALRIEACEAMVSIIWMHLRQPPVADGFVHRAARKSQPSLVEQRAELVRAGNPDHHWCGFGHIPKTLFARPQCCLRALAISQRSRLPNRHNQSYTKHPDAPGHPPGTLRDPDQSVRIPRVVQAVERILNDGSGDGTI